MEFLTTNSINYGPFSKVIFSVSKKRIFFSFFPISYFFAKSAKENNNLKEIAVRRCFLYQFPRGQIVACDLRCRLVWWQLFSSVRGWITLEPHEFIPNILGILWIWWREPFGDYGDSWQHCCSNFSFYDISGPFQRV